MLWRARPTWRPPDGPNDEENTGHLWDAALRAGLTVRNYGFFVDSGGAIACPQCAIPLAHDPYATGTVVAFPANVALYSIYTDPYYRGFDCNFPDYYRFTEWEREFNANYAAGGLPSLSSFERRARSHWIVLAPPLTL